MLEKVEVAYFKVPRWNFPGRI